MITYFLRYLFRDLTRWVISAESNFQQHYSFNPVPSIKQHTLFSEFINRRKGSKKGLNACIDRELKLHCIAEHIYAKVSLHFTINEFLHVWF